MITRIWLINIIILRYPLTLSILCVHNGDDVSISVLGIPAYIYIYYDDYVFSTGIYESPLVTYYINENADMVIA